MRTQTLAFVLLILSVSTAARADVIKDNLNYSMTATPRNSADADCREWTAAPIKFGDGFVIVGLKNREDASMDEFAKQRDTLVEQMIQQKRNAVFSDYLASVRQQLETDGKIVFYPDAIAKVDGPELPFNEDQGQ